MKIFTHNLVLFDNGFCLKWERKTDVDSFLTINLHELILWAVIIFLIFGG